MRLVIIQHHPPDAHSNITQTQYPMVSPESKTKPPKPPRSKPSSSGANSAKLKTVIRRLPPNLPEDVFWASVQEWVSEETVLWKQFHQGKIRKGCVIYLVGLSEVLDRC